MDQLATLTPTPPSGWIKWTPLVILGLALGIIIIDTTLLNVSIKYILEDLHTDIQSLQWVITAYSLTLAALTITGGRLGDFFGRKKMFLLGAILFAIGSLVASFSNTVGMLLLGESIIEGIGAALMMPATASLLLTTYQGRDRALAFGVWGGIAGAASAIGPVLGGFLTKYYNWRWGFRINVVVVLILLAGSYLIKESKDEAEQPAIDFVGVFLSAFGLLALVFGFIESSTYGWLAQKQDFIIGDTIIWGGPTSFVPFVIGLGVILLGLFALWERRVEAQGKTPLVSLSLFKNRQYSTGILTTTILTLGMTGMFFALPVFWQAVRNYDALSTGLVGLPTSIALLIVAPLGATIGHKVSPKLLIQVGLLLNALSVLWLSSLFSVTATWVTVAPALALFGVGMGLVFSQISNLTLSAVSPQQGGEAAGVNNTMRNVGSSFGAAILGAVLLSALTTNLATGIQESTSIPAAAKPQITEAVAKQSSAIEFGGTIHLGPNVPASILQEVHTIASQGTTDAVKKTLLYTALFSFIGFLSSFLLPTVKKVEKSQAAAPVGH
jgi:EmrB/QacA subfamily drug resistance transporter